MECATGFLFESSKMSTYWSTQETMQHFVDIHLAPHFEAVKVALGLSYRQCFLWLIDCWSVHCSKEFLMWMVEYHITIIVIFVSTGLIGLSQPCDMGFQQLFKHFLKLFSHNNTVQDLTQLKNGVSVDNIKIDTTLKVLCDCTVNWLLAAFNKLNKPDIVKKVSYEACQMLHDLPTTNPAFLTELSQP